MDATTSAESRPLQPRRYLLRRDFKLFARRFAQRYFDPIPFPEEGALRLAALHQQGEVVHVMRAVGVLNFLYLAWALLQNGLPALRAAIGLKFSFWSPFRRLFRKGTAADQLDRALDRGSTALVFLRQPSGLLAGTRPGDEAFLALIGRARKAVRPLYLVPDLFLWRARPRNLKPSIRDLVFGDPETPGRVLTAWSFLLNYRTAFFRVGEPIDLTAFVRANAQDSDAVLVRKVRGALGQHLSRETRAIVGPPLKAPERIIEETLRDRALRATLDQIAADQGLSPERARRRAQRNLEEIANRYVPAVVWMFKSLVSFVLSRLYQGVEVDEKDIARTLDLKRRAPVVYCPSHKSHLDYLLMGWVFADRGVVPPTVAAGANLSFFPLGFFLRRSSAFFLRRSFKGDPIYTATFKAYIKKLVREGQSQEFFIEGTRSRTGKLIQPKTGMLAFEVDAVLEGAQDDLIFVPVSIDYDKLVEARSYARESAGAEKKPESIKSLLAAPRVLATARSGRIYMAFGEPVSLKEFLAARVRDPAAMTPEQKRAAIMALAQRITWGIGRATTVTPAALLAAALLAHRRRGITAREAGGRIHALREAAAREGIRISPQLDQAPSDPSTLGPVNEVLRRFMEDGLVSAQVVGSDTLYTVPDDKRALLVLYKNSLVHLFATRSFAAFSLLSLDGAGTEAEALERFTYLAGMLKLEFSFAHGLHDAETLFREACDALAKEGLLVREAGRVALAPAPHAREDLAFLANLNRDLLESYRCFFSSLKRLNGPADRKSLVAHALETGRAEFLSGTLGCAEALSRPTFENALALCVESGALVEQDKKFALGPSLSAPGAIDAVLARLDRFLFRD